MSSRSRSSRPPQKEFGAAPHPTILAACALLGIDEVYAVGGAQAVALAAYGDAGAGHRAGRRDHRPGQRLCRRGQAPGARRGRHRRRGRTRPRSPCWPTTPPIPAHVAADLISQAEHDTLAASVLVTDCAALADAVDAEVERQVALTKHVERIRSALTGPQSATVLVRDLEQGLPSSTPTPPNTSRSSPRTPARWAERVRNAGCVFVGPARPGVAG